MFFKFRGYGNSDLIEKHTFVSDYIMHDKVHIRIFIYLDKDKDLQKDYFSSWYEGRCINKDGNMEKN